VTRRDGESLVLMTERESQARERLLEFAAQIITAATDERGTLAQRMAAQLPWMHALTAEDQATCADDLLRAARAALATNQAHLAVAELTSWRETATAIAAGFTPPTAEWLDDEPNVERP
jgi:hypothetical protein